MPIHQRRRAEPVHADAAQELPLCTRRGARSDLQAPVTREFCPNCGTHLTTRRTDVPFVIPKIGTLDDPSLYGAPQMAIFTVDKQPFHRVPDGLPTFERLPPR
jgi:hypothetical protein